MRVTPARRMAPAFKSTLACCTQEFENGSRKSEEEGIWFEAEGRQEDQATRSQGRQGQEGRQDEKERQVPAPAAGARRVGSGTGGFRRRPNGLAGAHVSRWLRRLLSVVGAISQGCEAHSDRLRGPRRRPRQHWRRGRAD